ncbi:MAG: polymer-forming cytoskeletal protein [Trueperaceae bacterium]|jgi:cytoskeletal protein CcmA (bactofilin family)|nr:polymer-forming cytoskeletal protein [Trueperaceae bacterium]MCC6311412.1 polymer-forming cytoskeletal protein [Trueperaceae bacterium]MCO5174099.1 polymer-forming cytoskeletal protein [Trueperaceae bacterium]MCW5820292.1 polymer-forming cytoskeletal protein [Trueperaceae bacterium]
MFRRRKEEAGAKPPPEPFTYVHRDTVLTGDVEAKGRVRVHGTVRGDLRVAGVLEVAQSGLVEAASLEADEIKVIGKVVAKLVVARGKVEVWKGGELVGDVRAAALDIEDGARFTGRSEMIAPAQAAMAEAPEDVAEARADPGAHHGGEAGAKGEAATRVSAHPTAVEHAHARGASRAQDPVTEADLL